MPKELLERLKSSAFSVAPFFLVILLLHVSGFFMLDSPLDPNDLPAYVSVFNPAFYSSQYANNIFGPVTLCFILAFIPLILGMSLFSIGADQAANKMGTLVGTSLTKKRSIALLALTATLLGTLITFAEPDLAVFSEQLFGANGRWTMMAVVAIGVGVLLGLALVRIIYEWDYRLVLFGLYLVVFGLAILVNRNEIFPVVFDGSGTTTGAVSAPFILALGIGVAQTKGGKNVEDDSFGISGLASMGPLISILIMMRFIPDLKLNIDLGKLLTGYGQLGELYSTFALSCLIDVSLSMAPLIVFFFIYQFFFLKLSGRELLKILVGLGYTFVGLYIFLLGANTGLIPIARKMGLVFATPELLQNFWSVILICICLGLVIVLAEPAVHVLGKQVEEVSRGSIRAKELFAMLCLAMATAVVLGILRVRYKIGLVEIIVPLLLVFFLLAFFVPELYTALAFDSSGIASGTMASCFLLPLCLGFAVGFLGKDAGNAQIAEYGSGVLGLVSTTPLIAIEFLGVYGRLKTVIYRRINKLRLREADDSQVIHLANGEPLSKEPG